MPSAVIRIFPPAGGRFNAVNYSAKKEKDGKATLLHFQHFGYLQYKETVTRQAFEQFLKDYSARNQKIKNPVFHAALSAKGQELSHEQLKDIALELMDALGYKDNPLLIYAHHDTDNNHVHIVTSRVGADGKKVQHDFEKKRAVEILNRILGKNIDMEFDKAIRESLQYRFSTAAQFLLLMEQKGYKASKTNDSEIAFFKYGSMQGTVSKETIDQTAKQYAFEKREVKRIQALLYKYQTLYDAALYARQPNLFDNSRKTYGSELTDFLQKNFGLQFTFFTGKDKEKPYGYAITDHANHIVYKGSDVFALDELIRPDISHERKEATTQPYADENDIVPSSFNSDDSTTTNFESEHSLLDIPQEAGLHKARHSDDEDEHGKRKRKSRR